MRLSFGLRLARRDAAHEKIDWFLKGIKL